MAIGEPETDQVAGQHRPSLLHNQCHLLRVRYASFSCRNRHDEAAEASGLQKLYRPASRFAGIGLGCGVDADSWRIGNAGWSAVKAGLVDGAVGAASIHGP